MSLTTATRPRFDRDLLPAEHFGDQQYRDAALVVVNRIRQDLGLQEADRFLAGNVGDARWGSPVSFTVVVGLGLAAAHYEKEDRRIVVDTVDEVREYPLTGGSVVGEFIRRFDAGAYPDLNARKEIQ